MHDRSLPRLGAIRGQRILIAEDNYIFARDLAKFFSEVGATIVGPFPTLDEALAHAGGADAAVLDVTLCGRKVYPLADLLSRQDIPFVFYTGYGCGRMPARFRIAEKLAKPLSAPIRVSADGDDVFHYLLPNLRLTARLLRHGLEAADLLVEQTLERAIQQLPERPAHVATSLWLIGLMMSVAEGEDQATRNRR